MKFKNSDQMKYFFKCEAKRLNISISNVYNTYFAREFLYRLSRNNPNAILVKGSSAEFTYLERLVRAITDIDLASIDGYLEAMPILIDTMCDYGDSSINYHLQKHITRTQSGIYKLSLEACYGTIRQPLNIDFQDHYNRLIEPEERTVPPIFEGDEPFLVLVPSYEEYLAENLCIIIENRDPDKLNTRVKDFYDIYQLHGGNYDPDKLTEYFKKMIILRNKVELQQASTLSLNQSFIERHQSIWDSTRKKYDFLDKEIDLAGAMYYARGVIREQLQKCGQEMPDNINIQYVKR